MDEYLVACWRDRTPPERILASAHERPPPPPEPPALSWAWCPWDEPTDPASAIERMDRLQDALRGRTATLARAWLVVTDELLWVDADCESAEEFANEFLGISLRQAQRLGALGRALSWHPELDEAIRDGLSPRAAAAVASVADEHTIGRWIAVAAQVGRKELARAVQDAREGSTRRTLATYERAVALADGWAATSRDAATSAGPVTSGPLAATSAGPVASAPIAATSAGPVASAPIAATSAGPVRVALPHVDSPPRESLVGAPPGVLEASRWWCDTVQIPKKHGFVAVKERERYRCQNPECGRVSLRNEAHHVVWRSRGGDDSQENAVTVRRPCHLRAIHSGRLQVARVDAGGVPGLLWTWPDGRRALVFRERP